MTKAIVVGSEGQDGRLLFDRLVADGWDVIGIGRESVRSTASGVEPPIDITDCRAVSHMVSMGETHAVFYLPAVHQSSEQTQVVDDTVLLEKSWRVHVHGLTCFLEALARQGSGSLFYAASSLVFGVPEAEPQNELTPFRPTSIYGITKAAGIDVCQYYRKRRPVRASAGILFNHESPLRSPGFVSQRIVSAAVGIAAGRRTKLTLGNLDARVDWGYAPDYIDAMLRIVSLPEGSEYVVATGETHTVREFVEIAFARLGLDWQEHVIEDPAILTRQHARLVGDATRLRRATGWAPSGTFAGMVEILVDEATPS